MDNRAHIAAKSGPSSISQFFAIWTGQAFSLFGSELVQFALVWWLTEQTGSATVLALATMVALLPQVFLSPFAGTLVDRWPRRTVMIVADGVIALAGVGLAIGALFFAGFLNAIVNASFFSALQAVVPPQMQGRVFTLVISACATMSPLGMAIAGPVSDALSIQGWFIIGGVAAIVMGAAMFFVPAVMQIEGQRIAVEP